MIGRCYLAALIFACGLFTACAHTPTFTGRGQQASRLFALDEGLAVFAMQHDGQSNFIVELLDDNGNRVGTLTNAVGLFDGSKAVRIPHSGNYLLNIDADGEWKVGLISPQLPGSD